MVSLIRSQATVKPHLRVQFFKTTTPPAPPQIFSQNSQLEGRTPGGLGTGGLDSRWPAGTGGKGKLTTVQASRISTCIMSRTQHSALKHSFHNSARLSRIRKICATTLRPKASQVAGWAQRSFEKGQAGQATKACCSRLSGSKFQVLSLLQLSRGLLQSVMHLLHSVRIVAAFGEQG